jgi:hypothetical protein
MFCFPNIPHRSNLEAPDISTDISYYTITGDFIKKMAVFWVVAPCSLVEIYQRFRGPCCLHHQGDRPDDGGNRRENLKSYLILLSILHSSLSGINRPSLHQDALLLIPRFK